MRRKPKVMPPGMQQLCDLFELFLNHYKTGLMCFFSDTVPFPDSEKLSELTCAPYKTEALGVRVQGGPDISYAQMVAERVMPIEQLLKKYGGIERFRTTFKLYEITEPGQAQVLKDLSKIGSLKFKNLEAVAEAHGSTPAAIRRKKKHAIVMIADDLFWRRYEDIKIGGTD